VEAAEEAVAEAEAAGDAVIESAVEEAAAEVEAVVEAVDETVADVVEAAEAAVDESLAEGSEMADTVAEAAAEAVTEAETTAEEVVEAAVEEAAAEVEAEAEAVNEAVAEVEETAAAAIEERVAEAVAEVEAAVEEADEVAAETAEATTALAAEAEAATDSATESAEKAGAEEVTEPVAEAAADAETGGAPETEVVETEDGQTRVVRRLAVGQPIEGVVKRTTEFGAFVDIGVGRDGLVHISELDTRRVGKVTDVLQEGQTVTVWIKKLDRERNRISLTLISPETKTIRDLQKDEIVTGKVTRIVPYGAFIDIGVGRDALLHVREMAEGYVAKPEDVVSEGEELEARIIEVSRRRGRIDLSLKGLRPEPEAAEPVATEPEVEEEVEDPFADVEVLSPMELAFRKAMAEEEGDVAGMTRKRSKRARRDQVRAIQDEIVSRTLDSGVN
jgi:small subunit ribosomal protein S1